jgi:Holliday junction resolvase RusA-like endonuclease
MSRRPGNVVRLNLPFPPSVNALWRKGRTGMYRSPSYMTWLNSAGYMLNAQHPGCIDGNYAIRIDLERKDNKRRDCDNFIKACSDLLITHGVITDDSLAEMVTVRWSPRVTGCRVSVRAVAAAPKKARAA